MQYNQQGKQTILLSIFLQFLLLLSQIHNFEILAEQSPLTIDPLNVVLTDFGVGQGWVDYDHPRLMADFNNDGLDDIIGFHDTEVFISYCTENSFAPKIPVSTSFCKSSLDFAYTTFVEYPRAVADVDGDGFADIIGFENDGVYVAFNKGAGQDGFLTKQKLYNDFGYNTYPSNRYNPRIVKDVNGDGKADIVAFDDLGVKIVFSTGRSDFTTIGPLLKINNDFNAAQTFVDAQYRLLFVDDVDGDGLADIAGLNYSNFRVSFQQPDGTFLASQINMYATFTQSDTWRSFDRDPRFVMDVNGDGRADLAAFSDRFVRLKYSHGRELMTGAEELFYYHKMGGLQGYLSFQTNPRFYAKLNHDKYADIIGFHDDGVKIGIFNSGGCVNSVNRDLATCECLPNFYTINPINNCLACQAPCQECKTDTICKTCQDNTKEIPSCLCNQGEYHDGSVCVSCVYPCTRCKSATDCITCQGSVTNRNDPPNCNCITGYYNNGSNDCTLCPERYSACHDENNGITCKGNFRDGIGNQCQCQAGYIEDPNSDNCQFCLTGCSTCLPDKTCTGSHDGYYVDTDGVAKQCDHTQCATCSSLVSCIVPCLSNCSECTVDNICNIPDDGFFLDGSNTPVACDHTKCATCSSLTVCLTPCDSNCAVCNSSNQCQTAKDGYYFDGSGNPQQCDHSICATCSSATTCDISCKAGCAQCNVLNECIVSEDGYYIDGSNDPQQCDHNLCATCSSPTVCLTPCLNNCQTCNAENECQVSEYGYFIESPSGSLHQCDHSKCATCTSITDCIDECLDGCDVCNKDNTCEIAKDGYFIDGSGIPQKCNNRKCAKCSGLADNCLVGESCNSDCATCGISKECLSCHIGYYLVGTNCLKCNENCYQCENGDSCSVCKNRENGSLLTPNCSCLDGYYASSTDLNCQKCPVSQCKVCDNDGICQECLNSSMELPLCNEKKIEQNGSYEKVVNEGNAQVTKTERCERQCMTCETTGQNCLSCISGLNRQAAPSCQCKEGYHDNNGTSIDCIPCPKFCSKCLGDNQCLKCDTNSEFLMLNTSSLECQCILGYKENQHEKCQKCFDYKGECLEICPKNTEANQENYYCKEINYQEKMNSGLIWICACTLLVILGLSKLFSAKYLLTKIASRNQKRESKTSRKKEILIQDQQK